ncbi:NUDIX domain-containing protein [Saccharibacillus sp. CPCC 101409]|uniref:NUDIX domain-containing protein n=1 Tax=Saccharibacillus sp. CPCC 101409 TaxID=3058041 RepID=UPI002672D318|nr:NUDIX domain-containing protein [Saccharibacillus sp. CPCC 101409]MDO3408171.1 NUDIX domain-containing protein [Saccharibacillus sp. CPCC 101409]
MFIVNVEGAIRRGDRWLLIRRGAAEEHAAGTLALVGGKVDADGPSSDVLESNLRREILEEVGLNVAKRMTYAHSTSFVTDRGDAVVNVVFACEYADGEASAASPDEVAEILWLTTQEILEREDVPEWTRASVERAEAVWGERE